MPWQVLRAVCLAIGATIALIPLTAFAWNVRFVVSTVAVVQSVNEGRTASGVIVAVFIALTYLTPRWHRQLAIRSQDADRFVADQQLGDALARFLGRCPPETRTFERVHHLTDPAVRPSVALGGGRP